MMGWLIPHLEWSNPIWLWAVLILPWVFWQRFRFKGMVVISSTKMWQQIPKSSKQYFAWIPAFFFTNSLLFWFIAASGPRIGNQHTEVKSDGIAIMMVVDTSSSMMALDLSTDSQERTRLDVIQDIFHQFVMGTDGFSGRSNDLIGLVRFAGFADTASPMTLDHQNLLQIAHNLQIVENRNEDGTAIGDALTLAVSRLADTKEQNKIAKSKVIVLLTDGSNNAGEEQPLTAAELAASQDIVIYSIGVGSNGSAPIRLTDPRTGRSQIRTMPVQIDEELLKSISDRTSGKYFRATNQEALVEIIKTIDQLEKSTLSERKYREYQELYGIFVMMAMASLTISLLLEHGVFKRGVS